MLKLKLPVATLAGCLLLLSACSKSEDTEMSRAVSSVSSGDSLLAYVPADTPYFLANLESPPGAVQDKLEQHADIVLRSYQKLLRAVAAEKAAELSNDGDEDEAEGLVAIAGPLSELMTLDGLRGAGIGRDSTVVVFGNGLLPVIRVSLTDGDLFEAAMRKVEEDAGEGMETATVDGMSYRYAGDDEGRVVIAVVGDHLVIGLVPTESSDEVLESVFGLSLPEKSIAETSILADLQKKYDFTPYYLGFVDVSNIAEVFLNVQSGANAQLLEQMEYDPAQLSDDCKSEIRHMAGLVPRLVTGYTEIGETRFQSNSIVELRPDIAAGLSALTAPVPGLGQPQGGLLSFGMSLNMLAAREFYSARLDAMEKDPFKCEHFSELQAGVSQGRQVLQQPVPPVVYDFKGFLAVVKEMEGLDIANQIPPTSIDMWLLLAMDNVQNLVAMGSMFSPELAGANLQPDGKVVPLNLPQLQATVGAAFAAMTESVLAISVGDGMEESLPDVLEGSPSDPSPFISTEMDAGRYYSFMADVMAMQAVEGEDAASPETREAMQDVMSSFGQVLDRVRIDIHFTERGIEMPSVAELKD